MVERTGVKKFKVVKRMGVELDELNWVDDSYWETNEAAKERQKELMDAGVVCVVIPV